MGRPTLAPQRREEILDAYESLLPRHGIDVSFKQIALAAGITPSIISHYFGSRAELERAVLERSVARHEEAFRAVAKRGVGSELVEALLEFMFGGEWHRLCRRDHILPQLFARSRQDPETRALLRRGFGVFEAVLQELLADAYADAEPDDRAAVAYALMCLGLANQDFLAIGFERNRNERAWDAARTWIARLEGTAGTRRRRERV